jgi:hypothetical protein
MKVGHRETAKIVSKDYSVTETGPGLLFCGRGNRI